ncbi:MAG: restriction endonuclease, partial [Patescibacteria group bacterium]
MNYWTKLSVEYANQRNYLDNLFSVYPTIPNGIRDVDKNIWKEIEKFFKKQDNVKLIESV